jgi:hypothetical protein
MTSDIEQTDFEALVQHLRDAFDATPPEGFVVGRTRLRDAVAGHLSCSQAEAERLVESMVARGMLVFEREQDGVGPGRWWIRTARA